MRIALVAPAAPFLLSESVHPPLGLFYLAAALKQHGHEVVYCDRGLGDRIPEADVYGITGTTPQLLPMRSLLAQLKELGKPIIAGGPHATLRPEELLAMGATAVVQGEGEEVLLDLLRDGITPGTVVQARRITNLDAIPFPDRSQARRYHYWITDRKGEKRAASTMIGSRGCPYRCAFCSHALWKQHYVARSAENVVAEIRELKEKHGYEAVHVFDDSFLVQRKRAELICQGIKPLGVTWRCFVRSDQVTPELYKLMAAAGCVEVGIGVESGSQRILDNIHKDETVAMQRTAIEWARNVGIRVKAFAIIGLPGEDWESIDQTIAFLKDAQPDSLDVTVLQLYPGAPITDDPARYGIRLLDEQSCWYKGRRGEYRANHATEKLSPEELLIARDYIAARFGTI